MKFLNLQFFKNHWPKILSLFFFVILFTAYVSTFAVFYTPGQTLDPTCAPGAGCGVTFSSTDLSDTTNIARFDTINSFTKTINLRAGSNTAGTAPLKFTNGAILDTTEAGTIEFDGNHLYLSLVDGGPRYQLDQQLGAGSMVYPSSGIAVSNGTGWGSSIVNNSTNWNTAYSQSRQWDGGSTGLVASTGRTSLGLGTAALNNTGDFVAVRSFGTAANSNVGDFATVAHNHNGVYAPVLGSDDNYVTDAEKIVIGNTSGTNTGDNEVNSLYSGLSTSKQNALSGTGFVKISGTTISYDNSTYVTGTPWTGMGYLTSSSIDDTVYGVGWDGDTTHTATKNAIYDKINSLPGGHNAVTLGTANGLSLSTQVLSLGLSSSGVTGALSGTDWNTFNNKQAPLVSGTNIKTINGTSLLGSGDIAISGAGGDVTGPASSTNNNVVFFNGTSGKVIKDSGVTLSGSNTGDNAVNTTYAGDYRAVNFVAGTNYLAPNGNGSALTGITATQVGLGNVTNNAQLITGNSTQNGYFHDLYLDNTTASNHLILDYGSATAADYTLTLLVGGNYNLTVAGTASVSGTNTGDQTNITGNAGTATAFATDPADCGANTWATTINASGTLGCTTVTYAGITTMTSANLASIISGETGTGNVVFNTSPTLVTPALGVATATSINGVALSTGAGATNYLAGDGTYDPLVSSQWTTTGSDIYYNTGRAFIGSTTETTSVAKLALTGTTNINGTTAGVIGILGGYTFNPSTGGTTQVGNRFVITNNPSVANTSIGEIIRTVDNTSLSNIVRGLDITSSGGSNTSGVNTGLRSTGATFGIQGVTTGTAGGVYVPAAIYGENTGTGSGDILRLYSTSVTSAPSFATFYHDTSSFTGTGLLMDFATGSGTFTGDFANFRKNSVSLFKVTSGGIVSMGLSGIAATSAVCSSLGNGATPAADTAYEIRDCSSAPVADYAEMYPVDSSIVKGDYGDIVTTGGDVVETYDVGIDGGVDWTKAKGNVSKLIKSAAPYQSNVIGIISDNYGDFSSVGYNVKIKDNSLPVALNGRVPVKISSSSESIKAGEYLTTSGDAGKAMKATDSGYVIGKALEDWSPASDKKTIMIFVENGYHEIPLYQNLGLKLLDIVNMDKPNIWRDAIISWLGNASNKITRIFTGEICLTDETGQTECINRNELHNLKSLLAQPIVASPTSSQSLTSKPAEVVPEVVAPIAPSEVPVVEKKVEVIPEVVAPVVSSEVPVVENKVEVVPATVAPSEVPTQGVESIPIPKVTQ